MQTVDYTKNIVEIKDVSFSYGSDEVLKDINLSIHTGDYLGLVGSNGSGKTTLLKIILGLLTPTSGSVKLFGKNIKEFKDWDRIGYVPQKATNFDANFPVTVREVVLMGRFGKRGLFHKVTDEDRQKASDALKVVDMLQYQNRPIGDSLWWSTTTCFYCEGACGGSRDCFLR